MKIELFYSPGCAQCATAREGLLPWPRERLNYRQQDPAADWTSGHGADPYEQNTQQSPALGLKSARHAPHS